MTADVRRLIAIAALPPSPAEQALHGAVDTAARIFRAALASPAPAPQGEEG